ncbi:hypothetical protein KKA53_04495 [Candidatus Dependentiae bacterium]|nr:hypothetical protein [Candidatus Dependentiae bacterium]
MNKIEKMFSVLDRKVDQNLGFLKGFFKKYFAVMSTILMGAFVLVFVLRVVYSRPHLIATIIEDDIKMIVLALEKIDARCSILSIDDEKNGVDFLNIKSFAGSMVGPLNLAYPNKWEGPYLSVNPTIQEKHYEIVKAGDGIFVVPGTGVQLPNGKIVGRDFKIDRTIIVARLLEEGGVLAYGDSRFASRLTFKIGDWEPWHFKQETVKSLDRMLREFQEAMPYTMLDAAEQENVTGIQS